jgi:hypothetical protein
MLKSRNRALHGQSRAYVSRSAAKLAPPMKLTLEEAQSGDYVTTAEAAAMHNLTVSGVQNWRSRGCGPRCYRVPGTRINLYLREEVREFVPPVDYKNARRARPVAPNIGQYRVPRQADLVDWLEKNRRLIADNAAEGED